MGDGRAEEDDEVVVDFLFEMLVAPWDGLLFLDVRAGFAEAAGCFLGGGTEKADA